MQSCARARAVDDPLERLMLTVLGALLDEQTRCAKPPAPQPGMWLDRRPGLGATEQLGVEEVCRRHQIEREEARLAYVLAPESEPPPRPLGRPPRRSAGTTYGVEVSPGESDLACGFVRDQGHRQPERDKLRRGRLVLGEVEVPKDRSVTKQHGGGSTLHGMEYVAASLTHHRDDPLDARCKVEMAAQRGGDVGQRPEGDDHHRSIGERISDRLLRRRLAVLIRACRRGPTAVYGRNREALGGKPGGKISGRAIGDLERPIAEDGRHADDLQPLRLEQCQQGQAVVGIGHPTGTAGRIGVHPDSPTIDGVRPGRRQAQLLDLAPSGAPRLDRQGKRRRRAMPDKTMNARAANLRIRMGIPPTSHPTAMATNMRRRGQLSKSSPSLSDQDRAARPSGKPPRGDRL
jgi:hypothetical protein